MSIGVAAMSTGAASGVPTPVVEVAKQAGIAAADAAMCVKIWQIYLDETLTASDLFDHLSEAGIVAAVAVGIGYGGVKLAEGIVAEAMNILGPVGWLLSAGVTASVTTAVGLAWMLFVEQVYRDRITSQGLRHQPRLLSA
jgi:hypothetical protein